MTLPELYERIGSLPTGGYLTVDSRFDEGYIYSLIHSARAFIVSQRWKNDGKIPPIYYQPFNPKYSAMSQDSEVCYTKYYNVPDIIALDGRASGLGFVGGDGTMCQFREIRSRAVFNSMMKSRVIKNSKTPYVLILGNGEVEVYSSSKSKLQNISMEAIFSDPTKVDTYNVDYDSYPMDVSDIPKMESYLMQGSMSLVYRTPIDRVNDQRDTTVPPPVR